MHDVFQNRRFFLSQDFFYQEAEKRRRWRVFLIVKRLLSVDIELIERRLLNIFEIYRVQNRFRASYVRNSIFLDYSDFALKWSDRMIVLSISTFPFVDRLFLALLIVKMIISIDSMFMSSSLCDYFWNSSKTIIFHEWKML
jgi:hypothetical protein